MDNQETHATLHTRHRMKAKKEIYRKYLKKNKQTKKTTTTPPKF